MTEVYVLDRGEDILPESCFAELPPWRRERTERLRNPAARQESLAVGLLLGYAMEQWGLSLGEPVEVLPAGKPVFARRPEVYFSLSHSGRYAMCAISTRPVGVDVQQMRRVNLSVARRLHPGEQEWLGDQPEAERETAFFRLWSRKEAWVKAVSRERMLSLHETDVIHCLPELWFRDWELPGGYRAAVCAREEILKEIVCLTGQNLLDDKKAKT